MDCACYAMESILIGAIFLYGNECTFDLVISLSVLMFRSNVGLCLPDAFVYSVDVTRYSSILLNSLSA